ncbi:MAG TPA: Imm9 family immunity protein [Puia sp.]|nr:Imm9 family immunity protein [Puia sp.]
MVTRILCSSYLFDFESSNKEINAVVKQEADRLAAQVHSDKLQDWEICFQFLYNNVKSILIYTKGRSYPVEKYKDIIVHIPMPTKDKVAWGVDIGQHLYASEDHLDHLLNGFHILDVDYNRFKSRNEYSLDCMQRAVEFCFTKGFTINKVSVKRKERVATRKLNR